MTNLNYPHKLYKVGTFTDMCEMIGMDFNEESLTKSEDDTKSEDNTKSKSETLHEKIELATSKTGINIKCVHGLLSKLGPALKKDYVWENILCESNGTSMLRPFSSIINIRKDFMPNKNVAEFDTKAFPKAIQMN